MDVQVIREEIIKHYVVYGIFLCFQKHVHNKMGYGCEHVSRVNGYNTFTIDFSHSCICDVVFFYLK